MKLLSHLGATMVAGHVSAFHSQLAAFEYIENRSSAGYINL
jgi:hypothetical protein